MTKMQYRKIPYVEKSLSRFVYGCATEPMLQGENVNCLLDDILEMGINVFDTAEVYGKSEETLGRWIRERKNREKIVIITKGCHPYERSRVTPEDLKRDIEQSLVRLGTDYIDIYLLHRDDLNVEPGTMVEVLNEYHRAGKIGAFGGSNWTHERIEKANEYAKRHNLVPFSVSSPNFSLCEQVSDPFGGGAGCVSISGEKNKTARKWYIDNQMPVFAYSSLAGGFLSGKVKSDDPKGAKKILNSFTLKGYYGTCNFERLHRAEQLAGEKQCSVSQIALAWLLNQDVFTFALVSAREKTRMEQNIRALDISLSKEEMSWLNLGSC